MDVLALLIVGMSLETIKTILTLVSGCCWTLVYIEGIRLGVRDRSYAIPFYALALNLSWELLHTYFGLQTKIDLQTVINAVWFLFDVGILYTYFRHGKRYFPANLAPWFVPWSVLGLFTAFWVEYAFVKEFGISAGGAYAAFLQNLLMSILFIAMLVRRGSTEGQSLTIAVNKWLGTLAPTIAFGIIGGPKPFILIVGLLCSVFDLIYIRMVSRYGTALSAKIGETR